MNTAEEIEGIKTASKIARMVLDEAHKVVGVGVTTEEIDKRVHEFTIENEAYPSPLNYYSFPKSVCTYGGYYLTVVLLTKSFATEFLILDRFKTET